MNITRPASSTPPLGTTRSLDYWWAALAAADYTATVGALSTRGNLLYGRQGNEPEGSGGAFWSDASGGTNTASAQQRDNTKFAGTPLYRLSPKSVFRAPLGMPFFQASSQLASTAEVPEEWQVYRWRALFAMTAITAGASGWEPWRCAFGLQFNAGGGGVLSGNGGALGNIGLFLTYDAVSGFWALWSKTLANSGSGSDGYNGGTNPHVTRLVTALPAAWGGDPTAKLCSAEMRVYNATPLRDAKFELYVNGGLRYSALWTPGSTVLPDPITQAYYGGAVCGTVYVDNPTSLYGTGGALWLASARTSVGPDTPGAY